jgi:metal-sulfur cluster biosynthetic enzyme
MDQTLFTELPADVDTAAILDSLIRVLDPELDEPIMQLGFVRSIRLRDGEATVGLQLPTSWCAINFAFIMAEDVRSALLAVDGIEKVIVRLGDHSSAAEIEAAVNNGRPFAAAFQGEGGAGLTALRTVFLRKGFVVRQERLLRELRAGGLSAAAISALRLESAAAPHIVAACSAIVLRRYLERRAELGLECSHTAPLIVDQNGAAVPAEQLESYYQRIRTVRVALEANGSFCRAVLGTRRSAPAAPFETTSVGETNVQA